MSDVEQHLALAGTRISIDTPEDLAFGIAREFLRSNITAQERWDALAADDNTFSKMATPDLIELMVRMSPEINRAMFDFLRMVNSGWEAVAWLPGTENVAPDNVQKDLAGIIHTIASLYGSFDIPINRAYSSAWMSGLYCMEIVLLKGGVGVADMATPDPRTIRWRRIIDPQRGQYWQPYQQQARKKVPLEGPTIAVVAIDPLPGEPEGKGWVEAALFPAVFLLALMHDLRRVISQQGYPRLDAVLDADMLLEWMPEDIRDDEQKKNDWVRKLIERIKSEYRGLKPDDLYIHTNHLTMNRPIGTIDASSLSAVNGVIAFLERQLVRALRTTPIVMGITDGVSEANANRQWEIFAAGIKSIQHLVEFTLERLLGVGMEGLGHQISVHFRFAELRAAEQLRDALTWTAEIAAWDMLYRQGLAGQDERAFKLLKHKADQAEPRQAVQAPTPVTAIDPETGIKKGDQSKSADQVTLELVRNLTVTIRALLHPKGYDAALPDLPADPEPTEAEAAIAADLFDEHTELPGLLDADDYQESDRILARALVKGIPLSVGSD